MSKEEKLVNLVAKIEWKRNRYRARHLVRVLEKAVREGRLDINSLKTSKNEKVRGIADTIEYLLLDEKSKASYRFDGKYSGWGLYETLKGGVHNGEWALWFGKIGGNAVVNGEHAGKLAEFYDDSEASGNYAGRFARFYDDSEASGKNAGYKAEFLGKSHF